ncbi:MAG: hypothetical protein MZU97_11010 [Bacillus subtilis]|nr:hypothetical protein [Bacillus subtilis]
MRLIFPSKLLINEFIKYAFNKNIKYLDFMRGKDPYKLWFVDEEESVNFNLNKKIVFKSYKIAYLLRDNAPKFMLPKRFKATNIEILLEEKARNLVTK